MGVKWDSLRRGLICSVGLLLLRGGCEPPPIPPELKSDGPVQIAIVATKETDVEGMIIRFRGIDAVVSDTRYGEQRVVAISRLAGAFFVSALPGTKQNVVMTLNVPDGFLWQIRFKVDEVAGTVIFRDGTYEDVFIPSGAQTGEKLFSFEGPIETKASQKAKLLIEWDPESSLVCNRGTGCHLKPTLKGIQAPPDPVVKIDFLPGQVVVIFKFGTTREQVEALNAQIGAQILEDDTRVNAELGLPPCYVMKLPEGMTESAAIKFYDMSELVRLASWNFIGGLREHLPASPRAREPDDTFFYSQKPYLYAIGAHEAWDFSTGSREVRVAILDTGAGLNHPDLFDNLNQTEGGNFVTAEENRLIQPHDLHGHGTAVAGLIGAVGNNGTDLTGVNWEVEMIPIRVARGETWQLKDLWKALDYVAALDNVTVVNISIGRLFAGITEEKVPKLQEWVTLLEDAFASDKLYVVAAPNIDEGLEQNLDLCSRTISAGGCFEVPSQLDIPHKIVVGASDSREPFGKAPFSAYGLSSIHLFAPGMDSFDLSEGMATLNLDSGSLPTMRQGTSFATALVTGAAALLAAHRPELRTDPGKLREVLLNAANIRPSLAGRCTTGPGGCGTLNVYQALTDQPKLLAGK